MRKTESAAKVKKRFQRGGDAGLFLRDNLHIDVPCPLVEVQIAPFPFHFTPLEVHRLTAGKMLFGNKRSRKVVVHNQPVGINSVGEEIAGIIILGRRRDAERLITGTHPTPSK